MAISKKLSSNKTKRWPVSIPAFAAIFLTIGYYLGSQHELIKLTHNKSSSSIGFDSPLTIDSTFGNRVTNRKTKSTGNNNNNTNIFRLHPSIELTERPELYRELVYPPVRKLVEKGEVENCASTQVKPYFEILKSIDEDPLYYEDANKKNSNQTCPVVFLFYFEGGSKIADTFFNYYSNIKTKRCLNFIVSSRWIDEPGTKEMAKNHGFKIVGKHQQRQDKTISTTLTEIKKQHGDDVLVSVNDLDHLLVWFDHSGKPHRYSSYTDMVRLYAYELLTTKGCSDQNVMEKYVIPCTCLMERNEKYISTVEDGVIWSEYGVNNRFHPTGNFYLNRSLAKKEDGDSDYVYSIGTVFANLRKYEVSMPSWYYMRAIEIFRCSFIIILSILVF